MLYTICILSLFPFISEGRKPAPRTNVKPIVQKAFNQQKPLTVTVKECVGSCAQRLSNVLNNGEKGVLNRSKSVDGKILSNIPAALMRAKQLGLETPKAALLAIATQSGAWLNSTKENAQNFVKDLVKGNVDKAQYKEVLEKCRTGA